MAKLTPSLLGQAKHLDQVQRWRELLGPELTERLIAEAHASLPVVRREFRRFRRIQKTAKSASASSS